MRVLIVSTNREQSPQAVIPLGACLVAAAARAAGHEVELLDLCFARRPEATLSELLRRNAYDVIGLSIRNLDNCDSCAPRTYLPAVRRLAAVCRQQSAARLVLGGSGVSQAPAAVRAYLGADAAVAGEGERIFPLLLAALAEADLGRPLPGVAWAGGAALPPGGGAATDGLPALRPAQVRNLATYRARDASWPLQTKRGCALRCAYCAYPNIEGGGWRLRDPAALADDLQAAHTSGLPFAEFVDGVFGLPQEHALACCEVAARVQSARRRPLPLCTMELNPGAVTRELVAGMNAAGFTAVAVTAESGSDSMLAAYGKNYNVDELQRAAALLRGLRAHKLWIFMLGGPGESAATVQQTARFLEALPDTDLVYVTHGVRVLPGTALLQRLVECGELQAGAELLWPTFYQSPEVTPHEAEVLLSASRFPSLNRATASDGNHRLAALAQRVVTRCRLKPPYWRYLRQINRVRRVVGL